MKEKSFFKEPLENSENGVLAALWRRLVNNNIFMQKYLGVKLKSYLSKEQKSISGETIKTKKKHSIENDIHGGKMTFPVFMHLLFNLMNAKELSITVRVKLEYGEDIIDTITIENPNATKTREGVISGNIENKTDGNDDSGSTEQK